MRENQSSRGNTKRKWILIVVLVVLTIGAYYYWFSSDAYIRRGNELKEQGKIVEAMRNYAKAYDDNFKYFEERMVGSNEERIANYTKLIELEPKNAMYYCGRAECYNRNGSYDAALADYTKAIEIGGKERNKYYEKRGRIYSKMFDREHAMADAENSAKDKTQLVAVLTDYGDSIWGNDQKHFDEAVFYYTKAIKVYEAIFRNTFTQRDPHLNRGNIQDYASKLADYTQVIKNGKVRIKQIEDESAKLGYKIQELLGRKAKSKDDELVWPYNDMYAAYKRLGDVYKRNGDWANAIENYAKAIEVNEILSSSPSDYAQGGWELWMLYACRGECYSSQGDYAKAVSDFTKALENISGYMVADHFSLYMAADNPQKANRGWCYLSRGYAYQDWGNTEQATADFVAWEKEEGHKNITDEGAVWIATWYRNQKYHKPIYTEEKGQ